jgi:hypothetical protein
MVLRSAYASEAVEQAVVDGITRHGEDFQLVVEPTSVVRPEPAAQSNTVAEPNTVARLPVADDVHAGRPLDPRN